MSFDDLCKMIKDPTISDDEVYRAIKLKIADRLDDLGTIVPMTSDEVMELEELGMLNDEIRPHLQEQLRREITEEHIRHRAVCQELKKKSEA